MATPPQGAIRVGLRAARRERFAVGVRVLGRALVLGSCLALVLVGLDRLLGLSLPWAVLVGGSIGIAALVAFVWIARRSPKALHGAALVDESMRSHDRLRNSISLAHATGNEDSAFVNLAISEGEQLARDADVTQAAPVRFGWAWGLWPALAALAITGGVLLPYRSVGAQSEGDRLPTLAERTEAIEQVEEALQSIRDAAIEEPELELASEEEIDRLEQLESELGEGTRTPEEAMAEAAEALEQTADALEREAEQTELERSAFEELASELASSDDAMSKELADRLRSGDFEQASEAARELLNQANEMSPEERERLAQELDQLAQQLEEQGQESTPSAEELSTPEQGADEAALSEPGSDQELGDRQRKAEERARDQARDLSDALRRSAEDVRRQSEQREPQGEPHSGEQQRPNENTGEPGDERPSKPGDRSEQGERRSESPTEQGESREQGESQREAGAEQGSEGQPEQGQGEQGDQSQGEGAEKQTQGEERSANESGEPREREQGQQGDQAQDAGERPQDSGDHRGAESGDGRESGEQRQPGQGDGQQPGEEPGREQEGEPGQGQQAPQPGDQPGQREGEGGSLEEQLERMSERQGRGAQQRDRAGELREQSRRLLGEPNPAGEGMAPGDSGPTGLERAPAPIENAPSTPVDARQAETDPELREQVIGDWYSDETLQRDPAARRAAGERIRDAAQGAERAIEQQRVPRRRRDFLRRVYERYTESAGSEGGLTPAGEQPGRDGGSP